ncbi:MAG TPA: type II toxin-antitoxin system RelE/ParE family toxin [Terriglobia bacterium]|nr:type II toxin-antitoxin system RelE/ParE family toxin [Terriglobia bacterium]
MDARVRKDIASFDKDAQRKLIARMESLANNPRPDGCVKLKGEEDSYRIRVGDYHIVYQIRDKELVVLVVRVGHRREVYR